MSQTFRVPAYARPHGTFRPRVWCRAEFHQAGSACSGNSPTWR